MYYALETFTGSLAGPDSNDVVGSHQYYVSVDAPSILTAYTSSDQNCEDGDTTLTLYRLDENNQWIEPAVASNDDDGNADGFTLCSALDVIDVDQGRYAVVVSGFDAIEQYTLDIMLTRDASVSGEYEGTMVQGIGSDGFDIDLAQTADVTAYVTADGVCVDAAALMLFGDDLSIPLASAQDFQLLDGGCQGLSLGLAAGTLLVRSLVRRVARSKLCPSSDN